MSLASQQVQDVLLRAWTEKDRIMMVECHWVSLHDTSQHTAGPLHLHFQLFPYVSSFQDGAECLCYVATSLLLCPLNHEWNHACLTCPSLANSHILFRLQLQKRERSCRFYVQVFATDFLFLFFFPSHPVVSSFIVVTIPPVTHSHFWHREA